MVNPAQRQIIEEGLANFAAFSKVVQAQNTGLLKSMRTNTPPPSAGQGRVMREKVDASLQKIVDLSHADMGEAKTRSIAAGRRSVLLLITVSGLMQLGVLAMLAWIAVRQVAQPLTGVTEQMNRLIAGDLNVEVAGAERRDEVGALARALAVFKGNAVEIKRAAAAHEAESAKAYRAQTLERLTKDFEGKIGALAQSLSSSANDMLETVAHSMSGARPVDNRWRAVGLGRNPVSEQKRRAMCRPVATATEELAASIQEIGRRVANSTSISGKAAAEAKRTDATVQALAEGAHKIGEVVDLINSIAGQTNLLALNATIKPRVPARPARASRSWRRK